MTTTQGIALAITALYGAVCLVGGIIGYVRADSVASLVSGGIAGVLLLVCAAGVLYQPTLAYSVAIIISVALLGRFVPILVKGWGQLGASNAPLVALIMTVGGALDILACAVALANRTPPSPLP